MVFFFTGFVAFVYLLNVPVRAAITVKAGRPVYFKIGVSLFGAPPIMERTYSLSLDQLMQSGGAFRKTAALPKIYALLKYAHGHLTAFHLKVKLSFGTGDAAQTAMLYGLISALSQLARRGVRITAQPDFKHAHLYLFAGGMAEIKFGHIMGALIIFALSKTNRRVQHAASH